MKSNPNEIINNRHGHRVYDAYLQGIDALFASFNLYYSLDYDEDDELDEIRSIANITISAERQSC